MANCPGCGYHLKIWNFKAECPKCGVNIPNYDWEVRLEEDAARSEWAFAKFRRTAANLKSGLVGTKLSIVRLVFTFVPLLALVIPMFRIDLNLPFYTYTGKSVSVLNIILAIVNGFDIPALFSLLKSPVVGKGYLLFTVGILLVALGVVAAVLNFFALILGSIRHRYGANYGLCGASILFFLAAVPVFAVGFSQMAQSGILAFTGTISAALFVGILLFAVNLFLNIVTSRHLKKLDREKNEEPLPPKPVSADKKAGKKQPVAV